MPLIADSFEIDDKIKKIAVSVAANLGVILSKRCNMRCANCITASSLFADDYPPQYDVPLMITNAAELRREGIGPSSISFTGGEPFLFLKDIEFLTLQANNLGLKSGVVTNAFWAKDYSKASCIAKSLKHVTRIDISTDIRHIQWVKLPTIRNAIEILSSTNQLGWIRIVRQPNDEKFFKKLINLLEKCNVREKLRESSIILIDKSGVPQLTEQSEVSSPLLGPCFSMSPVIDPSGIVFACCGALQNLKRNNPLILGDLRKEPLYEIYRRYHINPFVQALRIGGIKEVLNIISKTASVKYLPIKNDVSNMCYTCYHTFANLPVEVVQKIADSPDFTVLFAMTRYATYGEQLGIDLLPQSFLKYAEKYLLKENKSCEYY